MDTLITRAEQRRDGLILTSDLGKLGIGAHSVRELIADGHLTRVRRGVYVRAPRWKTLHVEQRYRELVRSIQHTSSRDLVVMGRSAAVMHGLPVVGEQTHRVHALTPGARGGSSNRFLATHLGPPDPESVLIDGVRVTCLARTLVDVARMEPPLTSVPAIDAALRKVEIGERMVGPGDGPSARPNRAILRDSLARLDPRIGGTRAADAIEFASPLAMSPGESFSRVRIRDLGFEIPTLQERFAFADGGHADSDFCWRSSHLLGEFDGAVKYLDGRLRDGLHADEVVVREKIREDRLRALGLTVIRWVWDVVLDERRFAAFLSRSGVPRA